MTPRFLLDTHIVLRWVGEPGRLSRDQERILDAVAEHREPVALSAVSLLEIAALKVSGRLRADLQGVFSFLQALPALQLLPVTFDIAIEASRLHALRDPADRAIAATALVHRLRLLTSDQRIIGSKLVPVVE